MSYLNEAFQSLECLNEDSDIFELTDDGIQELKDFEDSDDDMTVDIIDTEADTVEDVKDDYTGKVILDCNICHSKMFKDPSDVVIDEETQCANVEEECPYCATVDGFKIVGQVTEFKPETETNTDEENTDVVDDSDDSDDEKLDEDFKDISITTDDSTLEMHSDEDGKVTVTTEPVCDKCEETAEVVGDVADDVKAEIENPVDVENDVEPDEVDVDIEDFSEDDFDELSENYLKRVYDNVDSYKTTAVRQSGNGIVVEGLITFSSGKTKPTNFIFEAKSITKKGKAKFIGENQQICKGKKAFAVNGKVANGVFIAESLNYNYTAKNNNTSSKITGTVSKRNLNK